ncbi:MAG: F0F1 ATP synthase subunit B [Oscillospiraceae bacterium]|nr:F0F1 ATP synthase subunit B [Oscillospiraceae bacterium]
MEEYLSFVSIDAWTMIFTWVNLIILFLLLKKFLFKPINKMLDERAGEIENSYKTAENTKSEAAEIKAEYERRLQSAKSEADGIIKSAVETANTRSEGIVNEASEKAKHMLQRSKKQIESDKESAVREAREDIASMAVEIAGKIIGKKLDADTDAKLISDIIDRI